MKSEEQIRKKAKELYDLPPNVYNDFDEARLITLLWVLQDE